MKHNRGFTLVEAMIVVAMVALLTAMAITAYHRYVFRARRTDAHQLLLAAAHKEERWYATYNRYTDDVGKLGFDVDASTAHAYYTLDVSVNGKDAQGFVITATPINAQSTDACGTLSIDDVGHKTPNRDDDAAHTNGNCW